MSYKSKTKWFCVGQSVHLQVVCISEELSSCIPVKFLFFQRIFVVLLQFSYRSARLDRPITDGAPLRQSILHQDMDGCESFADEVRIVSGHEIGCNL